MGFWNPRAFCPECGGKIHTKAGGALTGTRCQHCGAELRGRAPTGPGQTALRPGEKTTLESLTERYPAAFSWKALAEKRKARKQRDPE